MTNNLSSNKINDGKEEVLGIWRRGAIYTIVSQSCDDSWKLQYIKVPEMPEELKHLYSDLPRFLLGDVQVIISTLSGTGQASAYYSKVLSPLLTAIGVAHTPLYTTNSNSIRKFASITSGTVVLLSGDGGLSELINNAKSRLKIIMFPMGTGNAVCNSYLTNNLLSLLRGLPIPLPNFKATFSQASVEGKPIRSIIGTVILSYGFHATLVEESEKLREQGARSFAMVAEELLKTPRRYGGSVNGEDMKGYAAAIMVKKLDKDFIVAPANGLRLVHTDTSDLMKGYSDGLDSWKVDRVEFEIESNGKVCVDGLIINASGRVVVEEEPGAHDLVI